MSALLKHLSDMPDEQREAWLPKWEGQDPEWPEWRLVYNETTWEVVDKDGYGLIPGYFEAESIALRQVTDRLDGMVIRIEPVRERGGPLVFYVWRRVAGYLGRFGWGDLDDATPFKNRLDATVAAMLAVDAQDSNT